MMMNMFSMFDPSSSIFKLNWIMLFMPAIIISISKKNKMMKLIKLLFFTIKKEIKPILIKPKSSSEMILISTFFLIATLNLLSLIPFNFTINTHIMLIFPLALSMWATFMMFGWMKVSKSMIMHSLPTGTPTILINFMIMIELISNIIRPITLTIRLSANMMAGHLLMNLFGSLINSVMSMIFIPLMMILLSILELAVSFIQGYVFMMLLTLYSKEMS